MALTFDLDSHLISTSADSCIFVWTLSHRVAEDSKQLQKNATTPSAISTPEGPDLNKTSYFGANEEFTVEIAAGDSPAIPHPVNGFASFGDDFVSGNPSEIVFDEIVPGLLN